MRHNTDGFKQENFDDSLKSLEKKRKAAKCCDDLEQEGVQVSPA